METPAANHDCSWEKEALAGRAELTEIRALLFAPKKPSESPAVSEAPTATSPVVAETLTEKIAEMPHQLVVAKHQRTRKSRLIH